MTDDISRPWEYDEAGMSPEPKPAIRHIPVNFRASLKVYPNETVQQALDRSWADFRKRVLDALAAHMEDPWGHI